MIHFISARRYATSGLVWLIGAMVCLSCCAAGPLVCCRGQWMDGCIPRRGTISLYESAATSKIVKRCCSRVFWYKQRNIKYPNLYLYVSRLSDYTSIVW